MFVFGRVFRILTVRGRGKGQLRPVTPKLSSVCRTRSPVTFLLPDLLSPNPKPTPVGPNGLAGFHMRSGPQHRAPNSPPEHSFRTNKTRAKNTSCQVLGIHWESLG